MLFIWYYIHYMYFGKQRFLYHSFFNYPEINFGFIYLDSILVLTPNSAYIGINTTHFKIPNYMVKGTSSDRFSTWFLFIFYYLASTHDLLISLFVTI